MDENRNEQIRKYRAEGYSLDAIALAYKMTRQRVYKICGPTGRPAVLRTVLVLPPAIPPPQPADAQAGGEI